SEFSDGLITWQYRLTDKPNRSFPIKPVCRTNIERPSEIFRRPFDGGFVSQSAYGRYSGITPLGSSCHT
ncbi:TPA: hypothetical protein ACFP41_001917, partial [Neisseria weaveri]